jgi:hypothetical protein
MRKVIILLAIILYSITNIGCDKDECPDCHECECICEK